VEQAEPRHRRSADLGSDHRPNVLRAFDEDPEIRVLRWPEVFSVNPVLGAVLNHEHDARLAVFKDNGVVRAHDLLKRPWVETQLEAIFVAALYGEASGILRLRRRQVWKRGSGEDGKKDGPLRHRSPHQRTV
jgi:hypothetical protein